MRYLKLSDVSLEITLVDDKFITEQNKKHMGKDGPTDVLSFPQIESSDQTSMDLKRFKSQFIGDVLVSLDQAQAQADQQGISLAREVLFLTLHSILHLLGYDHATKSQIRQMQGLESRVWRYVVLNKRKFRS